MAEFSLSTQGIQKQSSNGGLSANTLPLSSGVANIRAAKINPSAGNITFQASNIPKEVVNQTSEGLQHFMEVTADSVFRYEDRESTFYANKAAREFQERARARFQGTQNPDGTFTQGYMSTQKIDAIGGYSYFSGQMDEDMHETLQSLEPRARVKAVAQVQSARNQYLSQAANHRATELVKAQDEEFQNNIRIVTNNVLDFPESINTVNPITGQTTKQDFLDQFRTEEEGLNEWYSLIEDVVKLSYLNTQKQQRDLGVEEYKVSELATEAAATFMARHGEAELKDSPSHMVAVMSDIERWRTETLVAHARVFDSKLSTEIAIEKRNQAKIEASLSGARRENPLPREVLETMVDTRVISRPYFDMYINEVYDVEQNTMDPYIMQELRAEMVIAADDAIDPRPPGWFRNHGAMKGMPLSVYEDLLKFDDMLRKPETSVAYREFSTKLNSLVKIEQYGIADEGAEAAWKTSAQNRFAIGISEGKDPAILHREILSSLPSITVSKLDNLPPIAGIRIVSGAITSEDSANAVMAPIVAKVMDLERVANTSGRVSDLRAFEDALGELNNANILVEKHLQRLEFNKTLGLDK